MNFTLTLTRWHKVAERLNAGCKEREARTLAALTATEVSPWNRQGIETKAEEIAAQAKSDLALIESATEAVARIRAALAARNVQLGISEHLAQADAVSRRVKLYRELLGKQDVDMVRPEDLRHVPINAGADEARGFLRSPAPSVTLAIADKALLDDLRAKLAQEQARAHALLDAVADANREKLELELDRELAEIAGLAA